jgi:hypothetical protein
MNKIYERGQIKEENLDLGANWFENSHLPRNSEMGIDFDWKEDQNNLVSPMQTEMTEHEEGDKMWGFLNKFDEKKEKRIIKEAPLFCVRLLKTMPERLNKGGIIYVTKNGVEGSLRNTNRGVCVKQRGDLENPELCVSDAGEDFELKSGDLCIGRQIMKEDGTRPNDITLHPIDSSVSRVHAKIIYTHFLSKPEYLKIITSFLFGIHPRLGKYSFIRILPNELIRIIFSYFKPKRQVFLEDLASISGTFVQVNQNIILQKNMFFYIAPKLSFSIGKLKSVKIIEVEYPALKVQFYFGYPWSHLLKKNKIILVFDIEDSNRENSEILSAEYLFSSRFEISKRSDSNICMSTEECIEIKSRLKEQTHSLEYDCERGINSYEFVLKDKTNKSSGCYFLNGERFGIWVCTSRNKRKRERRYKPQPYSLQNGDVFKIGESKLQIFW